MSLPAWRIVLASVVGTSHIASGIPCQDHATQKVISSQGGEPVLILVVSDGAGTAPNSDVGSSLSCRILVELVETFFGSGRDVSAIDRTAAVDWVNRIATELESFALERGQLADDYACTLLAAIIGSRAAAFFQIGDGAIVVSHGEADGWSYVFWPQHGEFANTTIFITSDRAAESMDFEVVTRRINEIALFTDGLEKLVLHFESKSVHEPFFNSILFPVRASTANGFDEPLSGALAQYLLTPQVCDRTDDDKTLVIATRRQSDSGSISG